MSKNIIILGICDKAAYIYDVHPNFNKWNVLGLRSQFISPIFPFTLSNIYIAFSILANSTEKRYKIDVEDENGKFVGDLSIQYKTQRQEENDDSMIEKGRYVSIHKRSDGWITQFIKFDANLMIYAPGEYRLVAYADGVIEDVHTISIIPVNIPDITEEQRVALKSSPNAMKKAIMEFGCQNCDYKYKVYTALERDIELENKGYIFNKEISTTIKCDCGSTILDLSYVKKNLHAFLLGIYGHDEKIDFIPTYERSTIEVIRNEFNRLIDTKPKEEKIQKFINDNPILLSSFCAKKIFIKPKILTEYIADYGILTSNRELILIEIEKADIRLVKKDGGIHSELNHAFDQVKDWFSVVDDYKDAVLISMDIKKEDIDVIKGVVIAGRDNNYNKKALRKIKIYGDSKITFLSYDDLLYKIDTLMIELRKI